MKISKNECIEIFNAMIRGTPISFDKKLIPLVSEYLTENNIENSEKIINLILRNPQLLQQAMPKIVEYYCRKFNIFRIIKVPGVLDVNITKTILYYGEK